MSITKVLTNIQISQQTKLLAIIEVAKKLGIRQEELELYGDYKAKIKIETIEKYKDKKEGKLILVTAITPTKFGEGKTTVTIGLGLALTRLEKKALICLREPSLGPVFGIKGGATGGGYSQVLPMEDINLHFTGDFHAVSAANNLISAIIDNHLQQGNLLNIDTRQITWRRVMDMNDRSLRNIVIGLGGKSNGAPREDHFDITVASEIMAVLCLSKNLEDLKNRISKIVVASNTKGEPITVGDLKICGAVATLLKDAIKPNLVQTTENTPALIHGGPFANIAHGCNSLIATKFALKISDYVVTEAGFGADLGAEKFFDIKCRYGNLVPSAVVIVATVRALKHHGNGNIKNGLVNLGGHIKNIKKFGLEPVVAINKFTQDTTEEIEIIKNYCDKLNVAVSFCEVWLKGGKGGLDLAQKILKVTEKPNHFHYSYGLEKSISEKIEIIACKIYGADGIKLSETAKNQIAKYEKWGYGKLPICMAKTQYSFSDNPKLLGKPTGFTLNLSSLRLSAGAGFIVAITGEVMTMPGLPKNPAAETIDVDKNGKISGLS